MSSIRYAAIIIILCSFASKQKPESKIIAINRQLDHWHKSASDSDFDAYFSFMDSTCHFIGTDANENWSKKEFKEFCTPYFQQNETWSFTPLNREFNFNKDSTAACFYETLDTHMGACRGSGMIEYKSGRWFLMYYVLSLAIPNECMEDVKKVIRNENITDNKND